MANTYHQICIHTVFAVKYRQATLQPDWQSRLWAVIGNLLNEEGCQTILVNGVEDHVHCFFSLKPVLALSEVMKAVKAKSSKWINDQNLAPARFEWQEGYGAFSYGRS
jgi:REP element-mobilizing transposase RayT